jgi:lipopolysaccharide biosynthesis glycosyltransferase
MIKSRITQVKNMQRKPKLFFGVDNDYVWPLLVSLYSAKKGFSALNKVYILYDPNFLDFKMISFIQKQTRLIRVKTRFIPLNSLNHSYKKAHITPTAYLRLQVASISRGMAFWFDADLLFLDHWYQLLRYARNDGAKQHPIYARLHWGTPESATNQAIIESKGRYFNSGVLLINTKIWRTKSILENLVVIMSRSLELGFEWADQCVLNYYFQGEYGAIESVYNSLPSEYDFNLTRIIHFAGSHKPWTMRVTEECIFEKLTNLPLVSDVPQNERRAYEQYRFMERELYEIICAT